MVSLNMLSSIVSGVPGSMRVPGSRTATYGERAFSHAAPRLWNLLPKI